MTTAQIREDAARAIVQAAAELGWVTPGATLQQLHESLCRAAEERERLKSQERSPDAPHKAR